MSTSGIPAWARTFVPNKEVKATPIIISANVIVWLIMIATGVSPLLPDTESVRAWGASSTVDVTAGEYWRLWTSNYLHYGIIHLAVNMLSLNNIGRMLEQFIGTWRFALIYTFTGICGSAVSIWWNPFAVGVGASGAVLGIVGILLAILTTKLIEKTARMQMLRSMAISAGLMILISFQANVDNAAHLGGLVAGMVGGYFIFPELKAQYYQRKKQYLGLIAACLLMVGATGWFVVNAKAVEVRTIQQMLQDFNEREMKAEQAFANGDYKTPEAIDKNITEVYRYGLRQLDTIESSELNDDAKKYFSEVRQYIFARKKYFEFVAKGAQDGDSTVIDSLTYWKLKAEFALKTVNSR